MRARFEKVPSERHRSFHVEERRIARFDAPWHFHPEIELTLIVESRGRRFVGDSIEPFVEGDLVLLGPNLPHFWHNDGPQPEGGRAHSVVVQFRPDFLGPGIWRLPEFTGVQRLLQRASRGLQFRGPVSRAAAFRLRELPGAAGLDAMLKLWRILDDLSRAREARPLASAAFAPSLDRETERRLRRVYAFVMEHHTEPLALAQIARVAAMTPAAFSRYFKRASGRNVSDFLNDLRIDHAARLLSETTHGIAHVAAEAGFATLSNFNRRFRERLHVSPRAYRQASDANVELAPARFADGPS